MRRATAVVGVALFLAAASGAVPGAAAADLPALEAEVRAAEEAFAKTMADRNHAAFTSFLAEDAVFFGNGVNRGREAVAADWRKFYEGKDAPFSWSPERVAVLATGTLAMSSGPVFDPAGKRVGTFNSVWRREPDGRWKIVLDNGCPPCRCP